MLTLKTLRCRASGRDRDRSIARGLRALLIGSLLPLAALVQAQSIWTNPITDSNPSASNPFTAGQTVAANLSVSGIGRGPGINANSGGDRYNATAWSTGGIDANDYFYFTLTPSAGYKIDLTSLTGTWQRSSTGPTNFTLRSSLDNYATDIATGTPPTSAGAFSFSLSAASFNAITGSITFRLYGSTAGTAQGTSSVNDFTFNGTVIALPSITASTTSLPAFSTMQGTPSAAQTFTVSGSGLTSALLVSAPAGFELRENNVGNYGSSVSFTGATVSTKTIQVRLTGATAGNFSGNVSCTSTGASTRNIAVSGEVTNLATVVTLAPASSTVSENAGTHNLTLSIVNPSPSVATTADLVLTSGDAARVGGFTTQAISFPAGSSSNIVVPITITDNGYWDTGAQVTFALQNIAGGINASVTAPGTSTITINEYLGYSLLVNEVDASMPGEDAEFIELLNNGSTSLDVFGFRVELAYEDNGAQVYDEFDLPHFVLAPGARYVICGSLTTVPTGNLLTSTAVDFIATGLPAAVGLRNPAGTLIDALSYEGDVTGYGTGNGASLVDDGAEAGRSLTRIPDGTDTNTAADWTLGCATASASNLAQGSTCDDGDANTVLDLIQADCTCAGSTAPTNDCENVPNGPAMPGTACNDNDPETLNDTWTLECACVGTPVVRDCLGVIDGPAMPGTACDDANVYTSNDTWSAGCVCTGTLIPTPPQVSTVAASGIAAVSATLNGSITEVGSSALSTYGFEWSTNSGFTPGTGTNVPSSDLASGAFTATIGGLSPNTTYHFIAYASNTEGLTYGTRLSFTTGQLPAPVATAATAISGTSFTANWEAVAGATGYRLDVSTSPTFGTVTLATDLFLSEYLEGSSNNKYLEVFNGTGAPVDLSDYKLQLYANGVTTPGTELPLTGTLANGAVAVYSNSGGTIYSGPATPTTITFYNGDDALALFRISTNSYVDIFGRLGEDPGSVWSSGGIQTNEQTLIRKPNVTGGVTVNPTAGFPTLGTEWNSQPQNYAADLGQHTFNSYVPSFVAGYQDLAVSGLSQQVTGLTSGVTYYYRVRAIGGSSTSVNSNVIQVITGENDCLGVFNGPALPGTTCNDNDAGTINDRFDAGCVCVGEVPPPTDCLGVENGPAMPGTACDDNNVFTSNDTWSSECACVGTFVPTPPSVTTAAATSITATSGVLNGSLVSEGSSTVSAYGFEWSTSAGFTPGTGTVLASSDLNSGSFSATLSALAPGSAVYYVAFATNTEGTSYGSQMQLNTVALGVPVAIAATDVDATSFTANWSPVDFATGYLLDVSTSPTFSGAVPASDLIISEYVEGSSNNKYLELFNGTGATVDLSDYQLLLFANGASSASNTVALTGNLANGGTIVYKNSSAAIYGGAATNSAATNFNGDDAVALRRISTNSYVDIFGSIGNDPGTAWTATGLSTVDRTLVRRSSVSSGLSANPAATFPSLASEWDGFAQDDVSHLGQHTYNGQGPSFLPGYESLAVSGTSQVVSGLQPGQTYYYRVRAVIDALVSANSNTIDVTTVDPSGCTDPLAQNHDAGATEDDGSCTYCPATITYNTTIPTPIQIGTGLPADNAAVSVDCHPITIGLSAFERFVGPIVPVNDNVYRVALGNSPTSSSDPTPAPGLARWNYLLSVDLGTFDFTQVDVLLDVDFDPAAAPVWNTLDLSALLIAQGQGDTSLFQAAENMGFPFWQTFFPGATFDPNAVGTYSVRARVLSAVTNTLLTELPITVEVFCPDSDNDGTSDCDDECPNDPNKIVAGACGCGTEDIATTYYADADGDGFGDLNAPLAGFTCEVPEGHVSNSTDECPADADKQMPGACGCGTEDITTTYYADVDGDGLGDLNAPMAGFTCEVPVGYVSNSDDLCVSITGTVGSVCDDGNAGTVNDVLDANCVCVGQIVDCLNVPGGSATIGSPCDDGNASTGNDVYDANCVCVGETLDCLNVPGGSATIGSPCDDGNASTGNDVYDANCVCVGQTLDCLNVPGGSATIGSPCDDGNASTGNDVYDANCVCVGQVLDCLNLPGGSATIGSPCDDGNASTGNDVYDANCVCVGQVLDCLNVPGGSATIGSPCDDGNASTGNDMYDANCVCVGTPISGCNGNSATISIHTDANGGQISWVIVDDMGMTVASAGPFTGQNNTTVNTTVCLPNAFGDCYRLRLTDNFGDGITGGGWEVRDGNGAVVLKDSFSNGVYSPQLAPQTSTYGSGHPFCLPLGPSNIEAVHCGVFTNIRQSKVYCTEVPGATTYQFEFSDPDVGFIRRIALPRNWVRFSEMYTSPLLPGVVYFARVRVDQGLAGFADDHFGPGCELGMTAQTNCTALIDNPGSNTHSCGVTRTFGGSSRIWATPVNGATAYRFRFTHAASGYVRTIDRGNYLCQLNWSTLPLLNGNTYEVTVAVFINNAWTDFCGPVCDLTISNAPARPDLRGVETATAAEMQLFPNPNTGERVTLVANGLDVEATTATVTLVDLRGTVIHTSTIPSGEGAINTVLDLQGLANGVYLVRLSDGTQDHIQRLVIQR